MKYKDKSKKTQKQQQQQKTNSKFGNAEDVHKKECSRDVNAVNL